MDGGRGGSQGGRKEEREECEGGCESMFSGVAKTTATGSNIRVNRHIRKRRAHRPLDAVEAEHLEHAKHTQHLDCLFLEKTVGVLPWNLADKVNSKVAAEVQIADLGEVVNEEVVEAAIAANDPLSRDEVEHYVDEEKRIDDHVQDENHRAQAVAAELTKDTGILIQDLSADLPWKCPGRAVFKPRHVWHDNSNINAGEERHYVPIH